MARRDVAPRLNGAWEGVETWGENAEGEWKIDHVQPMLYLFLDGYYSIMYVAGDEARPLMPDDADRESISTEQMRSIFMRFIANSGTYEINGSTLTTDPMVALWPNFMESGSGTYEVDMQDGMLLLTTRGEDWWMTFKLRWLR
jgi:hypothetical protein